MTIARLIEGRSAAIISCEVSTSVGDAVAILAQRRIGAVAGIFSERDVVYQLAEHGEAMLRKPVGDVMTSPVISVDRQTGVLDALGLMTRRRIRHLPVVENGTLVGFVSIGDLVKYRIDNIVAEAEAMRVYIQSA